ncbi:hypothetical protein ACFY05_31910 [Microtetraspora fusca]|uniref:Uncharacterized protein n=1 Tax=Microtetraspora fusca TaxID=1997 RepID=A0ABW6VEY3_MICFU
MDLPNDPATTAVVDLESELLTIERQALDTERQRLHQAEGLLALVDDGLANARRILDEMQRIIQS